MTDVTGFGLIGHAREMALASNVSLQFFASRIPLLAGALECVQAGYIPGGLKANREFAECLVAYGRRGAGRHPHRSIRPTDRGRTPHRCGQC